MPVSGWLTTRSLHAPPKVNVSFFTRGQNIVALAVTAQYAGSADRITLKVSFVVWNFVLNHSSVYLFQIAFHQIKFGRCCLVHDRGVLLIILDSSCQCVNIAFKCNLFWEIATEMNFCKLLKLLMHILYMTVKYEQLNMAFDMNHFSSK